MPLVDIVLIGESAVGKSALIRRFSDNIFLPGFFTTLGTDFIRKEVDNNNTPLNVQVWDTAGQEKFRTITKNFYKRSDGLLLVYDMSTKDSYKTLNMWVNNINASAGDNIPRYLIANKSDLDENIEVTQKEGVVFAEKHNMKYFETSAKTGDNVHKVFKEIIKDAYETKKKRKKGSSFVLRKREEKKKSCCN